MKLRYPMDAKTAQALSTKDTPAALLEAAIARYERGERSRPQQAAPQQQQPTFEDIFYGAFASQAQAMAQQKARQPDTSAADGFIRMLQESAADTAANEKQRTQAFEDVFYSAFAPRR